MMQNRREFLWSAGAAVLATSVRPSGADEDEFPGARYAAAMVIDAMGDPGEFDPAADDFAPYSDRALGAIKASGVTAMNVNVCAVGNAPGRYEETVRNVAYFEREIAAHPDIFLKVRSIRDLDLAKASKRLGIVYCLQDTNILEGDLTRLGTCDALGVRAVQLTYNRRNLVGDGCLEPADGGLSGFGREVIAELNKRKILLDLSHGAPRTVMEGIGAAKAPMAITHTGCRALVDVPRNVSDTALKAMADRGGVVGIYFMPFLRTSGQAHAEDLMRHLEHAVKVCGEDHVGLGTDGVLSGYTLDAAFAEFQRKFFESRRKAGIAAPGEGPDVYNLVLEYNDPLRFKKLADDLDSRGWPAGRIEKILGSNFARLFREVWN